ncbi:MAG: hypothetical protein HOQ02_04400 [Lysobacter sp.]|nr:hypothetical protein [Lysobacter sp.]
MKTYPRQFSRWAVIPFSYTDLPTGVFVPLVKLPLGSYLVSGTVIKETASNAGTTDTVSAGTQAAPTGYVNASDFKTAGRTDFTGLPASKSVIASTIGLTRTVVGAAATQGAGVLLVQYVCPGVEDEVKA